jgi:hypothetical protein
MKRRPVVALMFVLVACGGETSRDGAGGNAGAGGTSGAGGASATGGFLGSGGTGNVSGSGGTSGTGTQGNGGIGGIDCSQAGCAQPPLCSVGCQAACGCCSCAPGEIVVIDGATYRCSGGCYASRCETDSDCLPSDYCDSSGHVCRTDGTCLDGLDCDLPGNTYARPKCIGYGVCGNGACSYNCGDPACRDLAGVFFGSCELFLGWAVVDGSCTGVSGCGRREHTFFPGQSECKATCIR